MTVYNIFDLLNVLLNVCVLSEALVYLLMNKLSGFLLLVK